MNTVQLWEVWEARARARGDSVKWYDFAVEVTELDEEDWEEQK